MAEILLPTDTLSKLPARQDPFGLLTGSEVGDAAVTALALFFSAYLIHDIAERLIANRRRSDHVNYFSLARVLVLRDWTTRRISLNGRPQHNTGRYPQRNRLPRVIVVMVSIFIIIIDFTLVVIGLPRARSSYFPPGQVPVVRVDIPTQTDIRQYAAEPCLRDTIVQENAFSEPTSRTSCAPLGLFAANFNLAEGAVIAITPPGNTGTNALLVTVIFRRLRANIFMTEALSWASEEWFMPIILDDDATDKYEALLRYWGQTLGFTVTRRLGNTISWSINASRAMPETAFHSVVLESARSVIRTGLKLEVQNANLTSGDGTVFTGKVRMGKHVGTIVTTLGSVILFANLLLMWGLIRLAGFHSQEWDGWWLMQTFGRLSGDDVMAGPNKRAEIQTVTQDDDTVQLVYRLIADDSEEEELVS